MSRDVDMWRDHAWERRFWLLRRAEPRCSRCVLLAWTTAVWVAVVVTLVVRVLS